MLTVINLNKMKKQKSKQPSLEHRQSEGDAVNMFTTLSFNYYQIFSSHFSIKKQERGEINSGYIQPTAASVFF